MGGRKVGERARRRIRKRLLLEEDGKGKLGGRGVKRNSETNPKKQRDEESKGGRSEMRKIQQCTKGKREKKKGAR